MQKDLTTTESIIEIRGARENNLKNVSVNIPTEQLVVITGPSGSGKSSLAFDTLFAEGQRRYMESLSAYARQFLEQFSRPDVDLIEGLSPAIAIEQKTISNHPRSTVGTVTGIYDFFRLLYARLGEVRDPDTGETLKAHTEEDILNYISSLTEGTKVQIFGSVVRGRKGEFLREFEQWRRAGFSKIKIDGQLRDLHDPILLSKYQNHDIDILLDTIIKGKKDSLDRVRETLKLGDKVAEGWIRVVVPAAEDRLFSRKIATNSADKIFPELEPRIFSFNSPYGMCPHCRGLGMVEKGSLKKSDRKKLVEDEDEDLDEETEEHFVTCPTCNGSRLRPEALWVYFEGLNICETSALPASDLLVHCNKILAKKPNAVVQRILEEVIQRLNFLDGVGVSYLSLDRRSTTLSGGEAQRIRLATQLGSQLSGVLYVLDEPSIGLHPRDHEKLLNSLHRLRDLGNSVVVVEHDEDTMLAADYLIDVGPGAGVHGGEIVAQGSPKEFLKNTSSQTAAFLRGDLVVTQQKARRKGSGLTLQLTHCTGHNLKDVSLKVPLGSFVVFTGVSGSGKSSLVKDTLEVAIARKLYRSSKDALPFQGLKGLENIDKLVHVDQRPIGRSPRSNPATYTGLFSPLRTVFSQTADAQIRGYGPGTFSFNVKGGRCDACEGVGKLKIEMHFLPNVYIPCETCNGNRYRREVLEVRFKGKSIADVLNMSVDEALSLFENQYLIEPKLRTLQEVGLGYIKLGQGATTLSGGEAQRIKLSKELSKRSTGKTLYFLDEPTTGLHFEDTRKLVELLQRLCEGGNTVLVIEHNMDVICGADWIIDIGPDAGANGGEIVFEGTPEQLANFKGRSNTARFVKEYFNRRQWKL